MSSLRDHFERVRAEKAARQANADPRLSARGRQLNRPLGNTMTRQTAPVQDAEYTDDEENPDAGSPIELKFFNDWQSLQGIQSQAKKNELKAVRHRIDGLEIQMKLGYRVQTVRHRIDGLENIK